MNKSIRFRIDAETAGSRLDEFLAARMGWLSRMRIADLLAQGACTVNAAQANAGGQRVSAGDLVEVTHGAETPNSMTPEPLPLEIVHEDADLLVVVKPAGMLVHPTRSVKSGTLANALAYHLNRPQFEETDESSSRASSERRVVRPGIVHRLDRATSGLLVVAKQQRALSILSRHFHQRKVEKRYLALVRGRVAEDECVISAPIGRDAEGEPKWRVMEGGKEALTRLRVIERRGSCALVELEPVTGRTNQLRIHCAHAGHPIAGDEWYGTDGGARLCLHAARLAFNHPSGGERLSFESPLPEEILKVFDS